MKTEAQNNDRVVRFWKTLNIVYERLLLLVLILILLIVSWCMYDNIYILTNTLDDSIKQYKPGRNNGLSADGDNPVLDEMVAWITIDGTNIDYPIMQTSDNLKYLNTDPFGKYSLSGSIYLDYRCSPDFSDSYSLIYGHHMEYGRMFGALDDFLDEKYFSNHRTGSLIIGTNAENTYDLEVFASMAANAKDKAIFGVKQDEIRSFISGHAQIYTHDSPERILGLSTCAEGNSLTRIVVFCYIKEAA